MMAAAAQRKDPPLWLAEKIGPRSSMGPCTTPLPGRVEQFSDSVGDTSVSRID